MNENSAEKSDEDNSKKFYNQNVRPKVRNYLCTKENEVSHSFVNSQNGVTLSNAEFSSIQNGASSSVSVSPTSSLLASSGSSCLNQLPLCKQNGEFSGEKCSAKVRALSAEENDLRNHDKKRKTNCLIDSESSSGNDGEEGLSSDECCIYTYKGDQFADLPNSFLSVDTGFSSVSETLRESHKKANHKRGAEDQDRNNLGSSPEMDYLEMDFDPGPSLEQDSEEDLSERKASYSSLVELPVLTVNKNEEEKNKLTEVIDTSENNRGYQPGSSHKNLYQCSSNSEAEMSDYNSNSFNRTKGFFSNCCESFCTVEGNSSKCNILKEGVKEKLENKVSKVISRTCSILMAERLDRSKILSENNDLNTLEDEEEILDRKSLFDGIMLWSEQEAISKQMNFISSDISCAATAVINTMLVLKMRISIEEVKQGVLTRLKAKSTSIPEYLISRSCAGFAHENIIRGIHHASHGLLFARFFQMYPRRDIILTNWLIHWMKKGAVPIATMNVQGNSASEDSKLDLRHHQMIFGVNNKGIYLTNPLECLQEEELWSRFISPSVLKIKRSDIVSRWSPDSNLKPLMFQNDERWKEMNVLGQVVNIIREFSDPGEQGKFLTQHIFIPASSGITLVIHKYSSSYHELVSAEDLPLISNSASE